MTKQIDHTAATHVCPECGIHLRWQDLVPSRPSAFGITPYGCPQCKTQAVPINPEEGGKTMKNTAEVIAIGLHTRPFTKGDWMAYAGAERGPNGEAPRIGYRGPWIVAADGAGVEVSWNGEHNMAKDCSYIEAVATADTLLDGDGAGLDTSGSIADGSRSAGMATLRAMGFRGICEPAPGPEQCPTCQTLYRAHNALENGAAGVGEVIGMLDDAMREAQDVVRSMERQNEGLQEDTSCPTHSNEGS